jgi:metal-responsive CopG/Arc/MetJ family transcriptional regulator
MKTLSVKLGDAIFEETDTLTSQLKISRNQYINEALRMFNIYKKRQLLKLEFTKESKLVMNDSLEVLHEFEMLKDVNEILRFKDS